MRQIGRVANRTLERDPMHGYLANLDPDDYQKFFRPHLPETIKGGEFLLRYGGTIDKATKVESGFTYPVSAPAQDIDGNPRPTGTGRTARYDAGSDQMTP